jgi:hypothetical protein
VLELSEKAKTAHLAGKDLKNLQKGGSLRNLGAALPTDSPYKWPAEE